MASLLWKMALTLSAAPSRARPRWVEVQSGPLCGMQLYLDARCEWAKEFAEGTYDRYVYDKLRESSIPRTGAVVWDIGAFAGYYSLMLASMVGPTGTVVAFEPNPSAVELLRQNLQKNPAWAKQVQVFCLALSNADGQDQFRCSSSFFESPLGYLAASGPPSERIARSVYDKFEEIPVPVSKADTLILRGFVPPSMIKVDVEGAEVFVLEGARELLSIHKPALLLEVHNIKNMLLVHDLLMRYGYHSQFLDNPQSRSSSRGFLLATCESSA